MLVGFLVDCESFIEIDYSMFNVKKIGFIRFVRGIFFF